MESSTINEDDRLLIGAYEGEKLVGVAIGSLAEPEDIPEKGIELNGLWVNSEYRDKGISLNLLKKLIAYYSSKGYEKMVIYNHHYAPSNGFYKKFGAEVSNKITQMNGKLEIDVFTVELEKMKRLIDNSLKKY